MGETLGSGVVNLRLLQPDLCGRGVKFLLGSQVPEPCEDSSRDLSCSEAAAVSCGSPYLPRAKASRCLLRSVLIQKMSVGEASQRRSGLSHPQEGAARLILPVFLHSELAHRRSVQTSLVLTKSFLFHCTCSAHSIKFNIYCLAYIAVKPDI